MKFVFWGIGKSEQNTAVLVDQFSQRLCHYIPFETDFFNARKSKGKIQAVKLKKMEAELILKKIEPSDLLILLDDKGKNFTSEAFAEQVSSWMQSSKKRVVFLVGGAYGFAPDIYKRANMKLSLSKMTFSHQLIRIVFLEQLYRAFTILNNEPYHNP